MARSFFLSIVSKCGTIVDHDVVAWDSLSPPVSILRVRDVDWEAYMMIC